MRDIRMFAIHVDWRARIGLSPAKRADEVTSGI